MLGMLALSEGRLPYIGPRKGIIRSISYLLHSRVVVCFIRELDLHAVFDACGDRFNPRCISTISNKILDAPRDLAFLPVADLVQCALGIVEDCFDIALLTAGVDVAQKCVQKLLVQQRVSDIVRKIESKQTVRGEHGNSITYER